MIHIRCKAASNEVISIYVDILEASASEFSGSVNWCLKLLVGTNGAEVSGWAFLSPQHIELRFETWPMMEPPAFLSGVVPKQTWEENSLNAIIASAEIELESLQQQLISFLDNCMFCFNPLRVAGVDMTEQPCHAFAYFYDGQAHRIVRTYSPPVSISDDELTELIQLLN